MRTYLPFASIVVAIVVAWWGISLIVGRGGTGTDVGAPTVTEVFASSTLGLSFAYPSAYDLVEADLLGADDALYRASLIEKGYVPPEAGEGPTSITVEVFRNGENGFTAESFAHKRTGGRGMGLAVARSVNGTEGVEYAWTGLYEGKSVAVALPEYVYEFSVTWLTPEDRILSDFDSVLESVEFAKE